ncbi:hypothetical protein L3Q82_024221 [Scortum barcoo]|uniref:Uncharacterized protein n=1 Tax=Scortum barcoo TaxID=214431 RepID=A0ACB8WV06_9TELE|nr:hypothetical protein L3Q82_024221 [Scortum barcoo]
MDSMTSVVGQALSSGTKREWSYPIISLIFVEFSVHDIQKYLVFSRKCQLIVICCLLEDEFAYIIFSLNLFTGGAGVCESLPNMNSALTGGGEGSLQKDPVGVSGTRWTADEGDGQQPQESVSLSYCQESGYIQSWDEFHDCANVAMAGCPDEAAAVWESLRQESKKMQFSGNLYDMCSKRNSHPVASVSPHGSPNQEEINQESLRGRADHLAGCLHRLVLLSPLLLLLFWI